MDALWDTCGPLQECIHCCDAALLQHTWRTWPGEEWHATVDGLEVGGVALDTRRHTALDHWNLDLNVGWSLE